MNRNRQQQADQQCQHQQQKQHYTHQHQRGQIHDNALAALVHDPLFRQRIEKSRKGKGSYQRKAKHPQGDYRQDSGKQVVHVFTTVLASACNQMA